MKDKTMAKADWRTVQFFLSPRGVFEVEIDLESEGVRCSCPGFSARKVCKHSRVVVDRAQKNDGTYPLRVSDRASELEITSSTKSSENFRKFVVKYGYIEV